MDPPMIFSHLYLRGIKESSYVWSHFSKWIEKYGEWLIRVTCLSESLIWDGLEKAVGCENLWV